MVFGLGALGCSKFRTARECGSFVAAIGAWKGQAPGAPASGAPRTLAAASSESRSLAERYDDLSRRIDGLRIESVELVPRAARYQQLAREAGRALRDVAAAVEKGDGEAARRRRVQFEDLASGEAALVAEINALCR